MAKYTNKQILKAYKSERFNKTKTARRLGISNQHLYRLISKDPKLKKMLIQAEEERLDTAEDVLLKMIEGENFQAVKFFLETKGRDRGYGNKVEVSRVDESTAILRALEQKYAEYL